MEAAFPSLTWLTCMYSPNLNPTFILEQNLRWNYYVEVAHSALTDHQNKCFHFVLHHNLFFALCYCCWCVDGFY